MDILEDPKIQQMIIRKKLSESRQKVYRTVLTTIHQLTGLTPTELIKEAKNEEKPYIENNQAVFLDIDDRKIKKYIYQYYHYLDQKNISPQSVEAYLKTLRSFYSEYNIELPKNIEIEQEKKLIQKDEIITKKSLRLALESTKNFRDKALILMMASSGIRSGDLRHFKIKDLLEATTDYHNGSIENLLESKEDIVPLWYFIPRKTRKKGNICVTFNSPEATKYLFHYLSKRKNLQPDDYLFESRGGGRLSNFGLISVFRKINDSSFGRTKKKKRYFKAHSLRKFFITKCTEKSGDMRKIALLSGHAPPVKTDSSYVSINFDIMRTFYIQLIPVLSIEDTEVHSVKSKEYLKLEQENQAKTDEINALKEADNAKTDELIALRKEQADLRKMVGDVLNKIED